MAAFENQSGPDLDLFAGQTWSDWQNAVESDTAESSKEKKLCSKQNKEVAKLKRQDFGLFGYCPAKDDFFVVVCEHCRLPVKPQAFSYHIEKYHKEKTKSSASTLKAIDPTGRSNLFNAYSALSCDNSLGESPTPSESSTNSADFANVKPLPQVFPLVPGGKKVFQDGIPASPNSKKRSSSGQESAKLTKSPSKVKQLKLDKESSPLTQRNIAKVKVPSVKKPSLGNSQPSSSSNLISQSPSSSQFQSKDNLQLPISAIPPFTSFTLSSAKDHSVVLNSAPVVVLEKSPILENAIPPFHSQTGERNTSNDVFSFHSSNFSSLPTTSYRQYTHRYNPQFDIVKSPDRGNIKHQAPPVNSTENQNSITVKPKKISSTLKVRAYDPNKHCGVWVSNENTRCTHSFTCKFHPKRDKREVPGRRKPFDDMLREHLFARNKAKEKSDSSVPKTSDARCVTDSAQVAVSGSSMQLSVNKFAMKVSPLQSPNATKVLSSAGPKSKSSVQLFPRSSSNLVDLWKDDMVQYEETSKDKNQSYTSKHPSPLTVCDYGSRRMGPHHLCLNRGTAFQCSVLSNMNKQVQKHSFVNLVELNRTTSHFTSVPPASAPVISALKSEKEAQQRRFNSAASSTGLHSSYARTKAGPRLTSHANARLRASSLGNNVHPKISLKKSYPGHPLRRNSLAPEASSSLFVPMPLDHRLSSDARAGSSSSRPEGSETAFPSAVNLVLKQEATSVPFSTNRNLSSFNQQRNPSLTFYNKREKIKSTPSKQASIKHSLSTLNGISSNVPLGRTIPHRSTSSEPQSLEDYNFTDDSTNSKTIQLNQTDLSGRRARFSQDANKASVTNTVKHNSSFDVDTNTDQFFDLLSGGPVASTAPCTNWQVQNVSLAHSSPRVDRKTRPIQGVNNAVENSNNENWATEFLSLLEPDDVTKNTSASSSQNFSYTLRDNFLNFSNDTTNIAEVSNT